ncbi:hypothetical protein Pan44_37850 [Caulifigura coniformis]|uniref:3-keto-alpha-glucoside-1,2-lyase/3-keto-2-hydroxy-glucal hydratase domain-containing protein n=1 Tax=Caulifigura coniformis TaxID=2527983 RepID=A0A517SHY7_9PLAN|nr:DUF1080 domain-containing protein [Caulifigura coniformis]QDT55738.1 hypothetical protein Pan44_37850 [Caulifigura coniformis]
MTLILRSALAFLVLSASAYAQNAKDGPTYTSPDKADGDFAFAGEYLGWQQLQGDLRGSQRIGVQVVALGNGKFTAVKYLGGLPGDGWLRGQRILLDGERTAEGVALKGNVTSLLVSPEEALVVDSLGNKLGELKRVHRESPTMGAKAPAGATVLFDGAGTDHFKKGRMTENGWLMAGTETSDAWNNFRLHGEFLLPYKPLARGQARGNSGFYLQGRYELQVLDSFGLEGGENECGALYKLVRPAVNMCFPPLEWQTYDIDFQAAKFDADGKKIEPMTISVWHNGVPIHAQRKIPSKTGAGTAEGPQPLPIKLQDHQNPVVYRNLWIIDTAKPDARDIDWLALPIKAPPVPVAVSDASGNQF